MYDFKSYSRFISLKGNNASFKLAVNNGFTLIEVLIALVILATGMLGALSLQAVGLKNSLVAYQTSQATQLAYNMADRMRVNLTDAEVETGKYATSATTASGAQASPAHSSCKTSSGCSVSEMAENDIYEWNYKVSSILPSGVGTISLDDSVYTITISWDDDRDSNTAALRLLMKFLI